MKTEIDAATAAATARVEAEKRLANAGPASLAASFSEQERRLRDELSREAEAHRDSAKVSQAQFDALTAQVADLELSLIPDGCECRKIHT